MNKDEGVVANSKILRQPRFLFSHKDPLSQLRRQLPKGASYCASLGGGGKISDFDGGGLKQIKDNSE